MSIGSDFERFLEQRKKVCSAEFLGLPDKFQPHVPLTDEHGPAGFIHRDNVMIELCVPPQDTGEGLATAVSRVLAAAEAWLGEAAPKVRIGPKASAFLGRAELNTPAAKELGCDIDYVSRDMDSVPRDALNAGILGQERYAGGHLHFSWPDEGIPAWVGASLCDLFIGLPEAEYLNPQRAQFYGAGSLHRPTQYPNGTRGVEYRPLDCYWTTTKAHLGRVAKRADAVHKVLTEGSIGLIRGLVDLWQPLDASRNTLVNMWKANIGRDVQGAATDLFRKEFGYDPV